MRCLPDVVLDKGDVLVFTGETKNIAELITTNSGLGTCRKWECLPVLDGPM